MQQRAHRKPLIDPFFDYCRQRLDDNPLLPITRLHAELVRLGYTGGEDWVRHQLRRAMPQAPHRQIRYPTPVPEAEASPATSRRRAARPLPITVRPLTGETLGSYLSRICTANHLELRVLTRLLPDWFGRILRDQRVRTPSRPFDMVQQLAAITGLPANGLARALPEFGLADNDPHRPSYLTTACRGCLAARGISHPVRVRLPRYQRLCTRHNIWISGTPQVDLTSCPEIITAQHKAIRLCRRYSPVQLLFAELTARSRLNDAPETEERSRRFHLLEDHNPALDPESLLDPATYPDTMAKAAEFLKRRFGPLQT